MSARFLTAVSGRAFNMRDRFGREIDYMRISVIDSCNLNCYYCNPQDNNKNCQAINTLSVKKVLCIVRTATRLGIMHFRLTGGEPLLHPQLDEMVLQIKKIQGVSSVSLTTNAVLLAQQAKQLKEAGIDSINVSLDTIDASEYEHITKKPLLEEVEHGIDAAIECGIRVKINVVLTPQTDVVALTRYASKKGIDIRFIEMMPVGAGHTNGVEPYKRVIGTLSGLYGEPCRVNTKETKEINSGYNKHKEERQAQAIHGKFCDTCNRIRVTADGRLMPCLGSSVTMDLVPDSCDNTDDVENDLVIAQALGAAIEAKPRCHNFNDNTVAYTKATETKAAEVNAARNMSRIGG